MEYSQISEQSMFQFQNQENAKNYNQGQEQSDRDFLSTDYESQSDIMKSPQYVWHSMEFDLLEDEDPHQFSVAVSNTFNDKPISCENYSFETPTEGTYDRIVITLTNLQRSHQWN